MRGTIVPAFEKQHPGVKVELAIGLSKDWVAKLKAAGKDNPPYDVVTTNEVWAAPLRAEGRYTKLPHELEPHLKEVDAKPRTQAETWSAWRRSARRDVTRSCRTSSCKTSRTWRRPSGSKTTRGCWRCPAPSASRI